MKHPFKLPLEVDSHKGQHYGLGRIREYTVEEAGGLTVLEFSSSELSEILYEDDGEGGGEHVDIGSRRLAHHFAAMPDAIALLEEAQKLTPGDAGQQMGLLFKITTFLEQLKKDTA